MAAQSQPMVLLVEDEPAQREVLAYNLEAEGFAVTQAADGEEAMLLVDEARLEDGGSLASYTVRGDEWFLQGHFPGNPVVPGVVLCEMLAQAGCLLIADQLTGKTPYLTGSKNARFRRKVKPGDTLSIRCEGQAKKPPFMFIKAEGSVAGEPAVSGEFSFVIEGGEE